MAEQGVVPIILQAQLIIKIYTAVFIKIPVVLQIDDEF